MLLVHGWALHGGFFGPQIEALGQDFNIIVPDLAGHGRSANVSGPFTIARLADDLHSQLEMQDIWDVLAVGWSMGAMVLWELIRRHGAARFAGLVIEDMTPHVPNGAGWNLGLAGYGPDADGLVRRAMRDNWIGYSASFAPRICARGLKAERAAIIAEASAAMAACAPEPMVELWASMAVQDYRGLLETLALPTLVVYGALSQLYPAATAEYLCARIPNATGIQFPRSGHAPHLEEPGRFNHAIEEFAAGLEGSRPWHAART